MTGIQYVNAKQEIFNLLAQVETLLEQAECDGMQLAELDCFADVNDKFSALVQTIDYYID